MRLTATLLCALVLFDIRASCQQRNGRTSEQLLTRIYLSLKDGYLRDMREAGEFIEQLWKSMETGEFNLFKRRKDEKFIQESMYWDEILDDLSEPLAGRIPNPGIISAPNSPPERFHFDLLKRADSEQWHYCNDVGKIAWRNDTVDLCNGRLCNIHQVNCSGQINNNFQGIPDEERNVAESCLITEITCYESGYKKHSMLDQHQMASCKASKFYCDTGIVLPKDMTNTRIRSCFAEIVCNDYTVFGWDYFGFTCAQQKPVCSGQVLPVANSTFFGVPVSNSCSVEKVPCDFSQSKLNKENCPNLKINCPANATGSTCGFDHVVVDCPASSSKPSCVVTSFLCSGVNSSVFVNASAASLNQIKNCFPSELKCNNDTVVDLTQKNQFSQTQNCRIEQLVCGNNLIAVQNAQSKPSLNDCLLKQVSCKTNSSCFNYELLCNGNPNSCTMDGFQAKCVNSNSCSGPLNVSRCICPLDFVGPDCLDQRKLSCSSKLIFPRLNCENPFYIDKNDPNSKLLDGDPACLIFSLKESANLRYDIICQFQEAPTISQDVEDANFTYYIQNERFSLTKPVNWEVKFKIFNFNMLSDEGATTFTSLSKSQMEGKASVWFNTTIGQIDSRYWHGNRLYTELRWSPKARYLKPAGAKSMLDRRFLDAPEYKGQGTQPGGSNTTTIIIVVVVLVVFFLAVAFVVKRNWKKIQTKIPTFLSK